jgi:hypothetical protein
MERDSPPHRDPPTDRIHRHGNHRFEGTQRERDREIERREKEREKREMWGRRECERKAY